MTIDEDATRPAPEGPTERARMTVAYDGSAFRGFAENAGVVTVGGVLREALVRVLAVPIELSCGGRTDAGVHAWGQVVSLDLPRGTDLGETQRAVNALCGPSVVIREATTAEADFDARFSARSRVYRYTVLNRGVPDPFLAETSWHVERPLDIRALRLACDPVIGLHDFTTFCRARKVAAGEPPATMLRRVVDARWHELGDGVFRFDIEATAFCHQMVRSLVATMVEMGWGRRHPGEMSGILRARHRAAAGGQVAPAHGLCLWEIRY